MLDFKSDNEQVNNFLKGRKYLLSETYSWIDGKDQEISMTSMEAQYQINCSKWLLIALKQLKELDEETQDELLPYLEEKMAEFKEIFPIVLKRESKKSDLKNKFTAIVKEFKAIHDEF